MEFPITLTTMTRVDAVCVAASRPNLQRMSTMGITSLTAFLVGAWRINRKVLRFGVAVE